MKSLLSSNPFFLETTYLIAVKKEAGLNSLLTITTFGMLYGSSLKRFNYSILFTKLFSQLAKPLFEG